MGRNITEPGDNTLKTCGFNDILTLESIRDLPSFNGSNSRVSNNIINLITVNKYDISAIKWYEISELTNPDDTRKNISIK